MATTPMAKLLQAINDDIGLRDEFIYYMEFEDYKHFPDPFPRTNFNVAEVQETIHRYPNPEKPGEPFRWDIHGRLLIPSNRSIPGIAVVMIQGGAENEYEFLFTPDGPEQYQDLTKVSPTASRAGIAQHVASLGVPVLAISLPGHFSRKPWPPIPTRLPEFVIGEIPGDIELKNRLAVYTYRMCLDAIKLLVEKHLPDHGLYMWGPSTGGEYFYLMEQYGLKNQLIGGLGFATGMPAGMFKEVDSITHQETRARQASKLTAVAELIRRSPDEANAVKIASHNPIWGTAENWFALENHRRAQFKPFLQEIEHRGLDSLVEQVRETSGLPDEELFISFNADLKRLSGKKLLYFVGEFDRGNWIDGEKKGLEFRRLVYAFRRFSDYAKKVRLVVVPRLTHYGHTELHNERLASMMVAGMKEYFP